MKKALSFLLATLLVVSGIAAVFMVSAGATELTPTVIYTAGSCTDEGYEHFSTVDLALVKANENNRKWKADDVLEIRFDGSFVAGGHNGILFSATTIWREDNTKLPIVIRGKDKASSVIDFDNAGGFYACANDYTFTDCSLMIGNDGTRFFAGSGDVTFDNCNLSVTTSSRVEIQDKTKQAQLIEIAKDATEWVCTENEVDVIPALEAWSSVITDPTSPFYDETLGYTFRAMASTGTVYGDWTHDGDVGGGQYLNACIVFEVITKRSCVGNTFEPDYTLRSGTWKALQELAHETVVSVYGEDYFAVPASAGDDGKFNVLFPGSSTCYYFADELASLGYHAGLDMKVCNPYISSLRINPQWTDYIQPENPGYAERIWVDSGNGAVLTSKGSQTLQEIIPRDTWDAVFIYAGTSGFDDYFSKFTEDYLSESQYAEYMELVYADLVHAKDTYAFLRENCAGARMLWYSAPVGPVGAFGSTTELKGYLFADNCYDGVYAGWNEEALKNVSSSITFGDDVQYICPKNKPAIHVAASGYLLGETSTALTDATAKNVKFIASGMDGIPEVLPVDTEATLIIDGENAAVYNIAAKIGGSPCDSTVWLKKGSVQRLTGDNYVDSASAGPIEQFYGDMTLKVTGGNVSNAVAATWDSTVRGDLEIYVSPDDNPITGITMVRGGFGNGNKQGNFTGNTTTTVKNVDIAGSLHLGGGSGNVVNTVENVNSSGYFIGARIGGPKSITNNLTNVTFAGEDASYKGSFMGTYGTMVYGDITNNLTNVTFPTAYYGGNVSGIAQGSITNNLTDCTVKGKYVGGNRLSVIKGSVVNNLTGGAFGQGDGTTFQSAYMGMESSSTRTDTIGVQIKNTLDGATFYGAYVYCGNNYASFADNAEVECRIENTVKNITAQRFIGSSANADVKNGKVKTVIQGTNTVNNFYAIANSREVLEGETRLQGSVSGGVYMASNGGAITTQKNYIEAGANQTANVYGGNNIGGTVTNLTNYIQGGTLTAFYGGCRDGGTVTNLTSFIQGGTVTTFYGANNKGTQVGSVTNYLQGGKIGDASDSNYKKAFYGANYEGTLNGNVTTTVEGNADVGIFYGGTETGTVSGNVINYLYGSGVTNFRGGSYNGTVTGNVTNHFGHETDPAKSAVFQTGKGYIGGNQEGGAINGTLTNYHNNTKIMATFYGGMRKGTVGKIVNYFRDGFTFGYTGTTTVYLGSNSTGKITESITNYFEGGNFGKLCTVYCGTAGPAAFDTASTAEYRIKNVFTGGIFGPIYVGSKTSVSTPIVTELRGGTFNGAIYDTRKEGTLTVSATSENALILNNAVTADSVVGAANKIYLGTDASLTASSAEGSIRIEQMEKWQKKTYVSLPEGNTATVAVTTGEGAGGAFVVDKVNGSVVSVKGGLRMVGATMILTDRVAVRALFDKASVEAMDDFSFSFVMGKESLAEGTKKDLALFDENHYGIVLAKIGAEDFTENVSLEDNGDLWGTEFSIKDLAVLAETAWKDNDKGVALAKAMQNFATIVADPAATLPYDLTPEAVDYTASGEIGTETAFTVTGKGLVMGNAVGIRIYGTADSDVTSDYFTVKVNGNDVTDLAVIGAGENAGEYTIDLYVHAKDMSSELQIEIIEKATGKVCLTLTDRVDAIAASYPEDNKLVQQLLVYIQAAVEYSKANA